MTKFQLIIICEELRPLKNEQLREVLYTFAPLKQVLKAVPVAKHFCRGNGIFKSHINSNDMKFVKRHLNKFSYRKVHGVIERVANSTRR